MAITLTAVRGGKGRVLGLPDYVRGDQGRVLQGGRVTLPHRQITSVVAPREGRVGPKRGPNPQMFSFLRDFGFQTFTKSVFGQLLESQEIFQPGSRVFTPDTGLHNDEGGCKPKILSV